MSLIPVTFKHSADDKKSGKVSTITARMLYANTFSGKVGIVKGYKRDDETDELSFGYDNTASTPTTFRLVFNKGAVSIYGGIGIIEQGTTYDVPKGLTNNSLGIRINLSNPAGQEMEWYVKPSTEELRKDDLQMHDTDGVYEFEICKITTTGDTPTVSEKTTQYIQSVKDYVEGRIDSMGFKQGSITVDDGFTALTIENNIKKRGYYCILNLNLGFTQAQLEDLIINQKNINIGTIPEGFRPQNIVETPFAIANVNYKFNTYDIGGSAVNIDIINQVSGTLIIYPSGVVKLAYPLVTINNQSLIKSMTPSCKLVSVGYETSHS